jgi:hypothetical protein
MPSDPIDEQILAQIQARLQAMVSGDLYFYSPGEVSRDWSNWDEVKSFPFYGVIEGRRTRSIDTYTTVTATLTVTIVGWVRHETERRIALNRAVADVIRAVYQDESWSGLALITAVTEIVTDEAAVAAKPYAYFELTLAIDYQLDRTAA